MNRSKSIVKQASFLAIAGILVRIIGLLYRSPLKNMITSEGIGYYSTAYNIYALILLISSYSIPTAISKLISEKLALNQYNNVQKILKCSFIYICAVGGGAATHLPNSRECIYSCTIYCYKKFCISIKSFMSNNLFIWIIRCFKRIFSSTSNNYLHIYFSNFRTNL